MTIIEKATYVLLSVIMMTYMQCAQAADVSVYHDIGTVHMNEFNSILNNDNDVTIIKVNGFLFGTMTNSFNDDGYFAGYQRNLYRNGSFYLDGGITALFGYKDHYYTDGQRIIDDPESKDVTYFAPIFSAGFEIVDGLSFQINSMADVINYGFKFDF